MALLCPAPRKNQVRYHGALGPASPLRPYLCKEARRLSASPDPGLLESAKETLRSKAKSWAVMLNRIPRAGARSTGRH